MRLLYSLAWLLALPFAFLYLLWRGRRQPEYRSHWRERLGEAPILPEGPVFWLHAVSVGETRAAAPLVTALRQRCPNCQILLTHTTPTGRATAREHFGPGVHQAYLPYDHPFLVERFLRRSHPSIGIFMETEVWPSFYAACRGRGVPIFLVNARLSERSAAGYRRVRRLIRPALECLEGVAAQTAADGARLTELGARQVSVCGSLKFDVPLPDHTFERAAHFRRLFAGRFVLLAASTRDGEEALILDHCLEIGIPNLLLVMVPRHPQRFDEVAALIKSRGIDFVRRSQEQPVSDQTEVFLGDSMGELAGYYAAADVAMIGGSLLPYGGQNLIEAAAAGCPLLLGPNTWNFLDIAEMAVTEGAAVRVTDCAELAAQVVRLHGDPAARQAMSEAGRAFSQAHRGATARVMAMLEPTLNRCRQH